MKIVKKMTQSNRTPDDSPSIEVIEVAAMSPHDQAVYEAAKTVLVESIKTGREFCKFMIGSSTSAIPIYLAILAVLFPEDYVLGVTAGIAISLPAIAFLVASVIFTLGYFPVTHEFSLDSVDEFDNVLKQVTRQRSRLIKLGFTIFVLATLIAIFSVIANIGAR
jgi:hypothetical protein